MLLQSPSWSNPAGFSKPLSSKNLDVPIVCQTQRSKAWMYNTNSLTRIALPIEVVFRVAGAFQVQLRLLPCRTMGERYMIVSNIVEEMNLLLF